MSSAPVARPRAEARAASAARRVGSPSVVEYCRARAGVSARTSRYAAAMPSASNSSGAGSPPAKLITSGRAVTARMSRTGEPPIDRARAASGGSGALGAVADAVSVTVMRAA
ncbi:hypothetical protein RKD44_003341 [Streptomyces collinus]